LPTYEYRCENGHQYEKREGFDAPAKQKCPTCKAVASRLLFAPPVVFKGSGFYKTDNRGSSGGGGNGTSAPAEAAETTGTAGTAESSSSAGTSTDTATESAAAS